MINAEQAYSYSRYAELQIDPIDLCEYFQYKLEIVPDLDLGKEFKPLGTTEARVGLAALQERISRIATRLISRNEQAKREFLIAPVLEYVVELADAMIRTEYAVEVSHQLQGRVDYLLSVDNLKQLLVIEAKNDDLDYGASQLMAEMIALDQWERSPTVEAQPTLLGAITTGPIWQFVSLHRFDRKVRQEVTSFRSPEDLEIIVRRLVGGLRA